MHVPKGNLGKNKVRKGSQKNRKSC